MFLQLKCLFLNIYNNKLVKKSDINIKQISKNSIEKKY